MTHFRAMDARRYRGQWMNVGMVQERGTRCLRARVDRNMGLRRGVIGVRRESVFERVRDHRGWKQVMGELFLRLRHKLVLRRGCVST